MVKIDQDMEIRLMMRMKRLIPVIFVFCLISAATAFSAEVGEPSPSIQFKTLEGEEVCLDQLRGEKAIFLVFWATWCMKCKDEVPAINALYEKFSSKGMAFLAVDVGVNDSEANVKKFISKNNLNYPVAFDRGGKFSRQFNVFGTPTILVIDRQGIVRYRSSHVPEDLDMHFQKLMASN